MSLNPACGKEAQMTHITEYCIQSQRQNNAYKQQEKKNLHKYSNTKDIKRFMYGSTETNFMQVFIFADVCIHYSGQLIGPNSTTRS